MRDGSSRVNFSLDFRKLPWLHVFDMLLKLGVDISRLKRQIRDALPKIDSVLREETQNEAVLTSTYSGDHLPGSLHYANLAVDLRLPGKNLDMVLHKLSLRLGPDYDVVAEPNHIHIEHDPPGVRKREV